MKKPKKKRRGKEGTKIRELWTVANPAAYARGNGKNVQIAKSADERCFLAKVASRSGGQRQCTDTGDRER